MSANRTFALNGLFLFLCLVLMFTGCKTNDVVIEKADPDSIAGIFSLEGTDKIIVISAPKGDFKSAGVSSLEVIDKANISKLVGALSNFSASSANIYRKIARDTSQHKVEFFSGNKKLVSLQMYERSLVNPIEKGAKFYEKEDKPFSKAVAELRLKQSSDSK